MSATPDNNTKALFLGTGEFSFSPTAATRADSKLKGFRDFGNIIAYTPSLTNDLVEHEGSYRGEKRVDEEFSIKQGMVYTIRGDELTLANLTIALMGQTTTPHTQDAYTADAVDALAFTADLPSVSDRWYDLYDDEVQLRSLTSLDIASGAPVAVTPESDDETIAEAAHTRENGDRILLDGAGVPTGLTAGTIYYVRDVVAGTSYKLAETAGGAVVLFSTDGTGTTVQTVLEEDTDYEVDLDLGRVRFLTTRTATVTPIVTATAITSNDETYMTAVRPLTQGSFEGYGRLVTFHQKTKKPFMDHMNFSCTVTVESLTEADGKTVQAYQMRVRVGSDTGKCLLTRRAG